MKKSLKKRRGLNEVFLFYIYQILFDFNYENFTEGLLSISKNGKEF